jgi:hypothetical protein
MYKVFGEIPTKEFETKEEAEKYIKEWKDGMESELYIVLAYNKK